MSAVLVLMGVLAMGPVQPAASEIDTECAIAIKVAIDEYIRRYDGDANWSNIFQEKFNEMGCTKEGGVITVYFSPAEYEVGGDVETIISRANYKVLRVIYGR